MSYVRAKYINGYGPYYYEVETEKVDGRTVQKHVRYLGKNKPAGKGELGTTERDKMDDARKVDRVGDHKIKATKNETLGESFGFQLSPPNSALSSMAIGHENVVEKVENTHTVEYKETGWVVEFDTVFTENDSKDGGRVIMTPRSAYKPENEYGPEVRRTYDKIDPKCALIWRKKDGERVLVDVITDKEYRGKGLAKASVDQYDKKYGNIIFYGTFSKQGASLASKYPDAKIMYAPDEDT